MIEEITLILRKEGTSSGTRWIIDKITFIIGETTTAQSIKTITGTAMRDRDTITTAVTISKRIGGMRGFSALRGIRMIGITETTIEFIIKIIIMRDISHLSLTIIMNMVNGIINARKITTEVTNQGMIEEMIVIARQLITSKITEVKISECLPEVSKDKEVS